MARIRIIVIIIGALAVLVGGWYAFDRAAYTDTGDASSEKRISYSAGESVMSLASRLEEAGLVAHSLYFLYYVWNEGLQGRLQAGEYAFEGGMNVSEIAAKLTAGDTIPLGVKVTFPEGWTATEMALRLEENGLRGGEFLELVNAPDAGLRDRFGFLSILPAGASLEGFLFPDTYYFDPSGDGRDIVEKMLVTFGEKAWPALAKSKTGAEYDSLILASIVESEVRIESDRRIVADIFLRRLEVGMPLQSDATVRYALGVRKRQYDATDIANDSPYNTYRREGLPPGPIANPGVEAIDSTLYPTPNDYWYFLNNPDTGASVFSLTFDEHRENKVRNGL